MRGTLKIIVGPMCSGKSSTMLRYIERAQIAKKNIAVFKPSADSRSGDAIASRTGASTAAISAWDPIEILELASGVEIVFIDEIHLFEMRPTKAPLEGVIVRLLTNGKNVVVSGLDMDFMAQPFNGVARLLARADEVIKLTSVCSVCGSDSATLTQKLIDGKPATVNSPRFDVGGDEKYVAVCRDCHVIEDA